MEGASTDSAGTQVLAVDFGAAAKTGADHGEGEPQLQGDLLERELVEEAEADDVAPLGGNTLERLGHDRRLLAVGGDSAGGC